MTEADSAGPYRLLDLLGQGGMGVVRRGLGADDLLVDGAPVVIDFGIAHAVNATRLTCTGQVVGTPGYMGPEVIEGAAPGPAVDVYGWAATVTFAASGRSPFGTGSLESVLSRIASGRPDLDGVPPGLAPCLRAALDRDPERRPPAARLARWVREVDLGAGERDVREGERGPLGDRAGPDVPAEPPPYGQRRAGRRRDEPRVQQDRHEHEGRACLRAPRWEEQVTGPRTLAPRRQLVRLLSAAAQGRRSTTGAGLVIGVFTLAMVFAVWATPPSWWPLPSPYPVFGRLADLGGGLVRDSH